MSPRFPFAIVIDGTTVLPQAMRRELDLRTLPLHVSFGAESYTAEVDLSSEQFYERIKDPKAKPTTSQPSIGECRGVYEQAVNFRTVTAQGGSGGTDSATLDYHAGDAFGPYYVSGASYFVQALPTDAWTFSYGIV